MGSTPNRSLRSFGNAPSSRWISSRLAGRHSLRPLLAAEGIHFIEPGEYTPAMDQWLTQYFATNIFPVLTPLAFDPGHPFPYISNLSMNLAVRVKHSGRTKFARVKVPGMLPRFVAIPEALSPRPSGGTSYVFLEDVIRRNIQELFPGTQVEGAHLFRIIRDTDMVIQEDEADDLLETVDRGLKQLRYGALSLLQVEEDMPRRVLNILVENFEVGDDIVVRTSERMGFADWSALTAAASAGVEGSGVPPAAALVARSSRQGLRGDRRPGLPGPSPLRFVHDDRDVSARGRERPASRRDQDDALPDRRQLAAGRSADRSRRTGQAGGGPGRAEGALRRAQQHRVGERGWSRRASMSSTDS